MHVGGSIAPWYRLTRWKLSCKVRGRDADHAEAQQVVHATRSRATFSMKLHAASALPQSFLPKLRPSSAMRTWPAQLSRQGCEDHSGLINASQAGVNVDLIVHGGCGPG